MTTTINKSDSLWQQQQQHQHQKHKQKQKQREKKEKQQQNLMQKLKTLDDNLTPTLTDSKLKITNEVAPAKVATTITTANNLVSNSVAQAMRVTATATLTPTPTATITFNTLAMDSINNNNVLVEGDDAYTYHDEEIYTAYNNNNTVIPAIIKTSSMTTSTTTTTTPLTGEIEQSKSHKRKSLLNFKSLDFHLKSLYTGLRNGNTNKTSQSQSSTLDSSNTIDSRIMNENVLGQQQQQQQHLQHQTFKRMPPYLKIEYVDNEEVENLLIDYAQSPYSTRRNSSHDDHRSSSQLLHFSDAHHLQRPYHPYEIARSQACSPSPYFLSPHVFDTSSSQTIRRSSTSDIVAGGGSGNVNVHSTGGGGGGSVSGSGGGGYYGKRSATASAQPSRRPSTSDLLRRARERRGNDARMGRSMSHSGLTRGGGATLGYRPSSGRRTSMAF